MTLSIVPRLQTIYKEDMLKTRLFADFFALEHAEHFLGGDVSVKQMLP